MRGLLLRGLLLLDATRRVIRCGGAQRLLARRTDQTSSRSSVRRIPRRLELLESCRVDVATAPIWSPFVRVPAEHELKDRKLRRLGHGRAARASRGSRPKASERVAPAAIGRLAPRSASEGDCIPGLREGSVARLLGFVGSDVNRMLLLLPDETANDRFSTCLYQISELRLASAVRSFVVRSLVRSLRVLSCGVVLHYL